MPAWDMALRPVGKEAVGEATCRGQGHCQEQRKTTWHRPAEPTLQLGIVT